jgi:multidrug efflux pump subunit AcrA (membrane-fusion protein)
MIERNEGEHLSPAEQPPRVYPAKHGVLVAFIALLIIAIVVIAGVVPRWRARAALRTETYNLAVPSVSIIHPKLGASQTEIVLPGNIQAFTDSPIYARTNGYLKSWYADIGTRVKRGQLLADIETPEVDQQLDQARADLNTAQANYRLSQITSSRYQDLLKTDAVSKQDVDNANGDFEAKKAMVASALSNVKRLEQLQSFEKIYAPFDHRPEYGRGPSHQFRSGRARHGTISHRRAGKIARLHQRAAAEFRVCQARTQCRPYSSGISGTQVQGQPGSHGRLHRSRVANPAG